MNCEILLRHRNRKKTHIAAVMLDFLMLSLLMCSRLLTLAQGFCSGAVRGDVTECRLRGSAASEKGGRRPASQPQVLCFVAIRRLQDARQGVHYAFRGEPLELQ